jgi:hypothetical protein
MDKEVDLSDVGMADAPTLLGWRVLLTESVLNTCIKVPQGVEGQTMAGRVSDLRAFLEYHLKQAPEQGNGRLNAGFAFYHSVVNDNRKRSEYGDGPEMPGTAVPLSVVASIDYDGAPCLVVLHSEEDFPG